MHHRITTDGTRIECGCDATGDHPDQPPVEDVAEEPEKPLTDVAARPDVLTGSAEPAGELIE